MNRLRVTILLAASVLLFCQHAHAQSSLLNYEHRVIRAAEQVERIKSDSDYAEEAIPYIKRLLPKSEVVEQSGRKIAVDNGWLWEVLDSYSKEPDQQARTAKLNEAAGRLRALDEHLQRAEPVSEQTAGGEADRERLREILSRAEYQPHEETLIGKYIKKALTKIREGLAFVRDSLIRLLEYVFGAGSSGAIVPKLIVIASIALAIAMVIAMLRRLKPVKRRKKKRIVLGEEVGVDTTPDELVSAAMAAAQSGDFRSAIRKLYVSLLFDLAERRLIELDDSATNREYLKRVSQYGALASPMRFLTDRFDFVWYGMFATSQEDFAACLARYREAIGSAESLVQQNAGA